MYQKLLADLRTTGYKHLTVKIGLIFKRGHLGNNRDCILLMDIRRKAGSVSVMILTIRDLF